ncbi:MAG: histidine triad nucleotide-binding protein [Candidatus Latescibacteria bacterium]|nr:histidine triad nucleotide-binding protein [Candidatus Latescibacterota bacterium]
MSTCVFCKVVSGEVPSRRIYEDDDTVAFEDSNKMAPVHILIIPKRHIATLLDLTDGEADLVGKMILIANQIARERKIDRSGYRLVFNCNAGGGQSVYHLHLHLLGGRRMTWPPG